MAGEMTGADLPRVPQEQGPSTSPKTEAGTTAQVEVIGVPNSEEAELLALEDDTPSDPRSVVLDEPTDPPPETEDLDPAQLTRVEETGLETHRTTQRIERLLDPVEGNRKNDPGQIIIRLLRRALRRLAALEEGVEQLDARMATLEDGLQRVEMRLPKTQVPSPEETGPFG